MISALIFAAAWFAVAPMAPVDSNSTLITNAIAVEGVASTEIPADACKLTYAITTHRRTSAEAMAALKLARDAFLRTIHAASGNDTGADFGVIAITRSTGRSERDQIFEASQTADVMLAGLPADHESVDRIIMQVTTALLDCFSGPDVLTGPAVTFQVTRLSSIEPRLVQMASDDAQRRAEATAKVLGKRINRARAAFFPGRVTIDGIPRAFTEGPVSIDGDKPSVIVTYTVKVAYAIEQESSPATAIPAPRKKE